jgi:Zn-dependent peptidase ImmA (M78 family)
MIKTSTAPHELFHAVFNIWDKDTYDKIIKDAMKYTNQNSRQVEEELADAFAHYFNT